MANKSSWEAKGKVARTTHYFLENEILKDDELALMRTMVLKNKNDDIVVPVARKSKPHFRVLWANKKESASSKPSDKTHDQCIAYILKIIRNAKNLVQILTLAFSKDDEPLESGQSSRDLQIIFRAEADGLYRWYKGVDCRLRIPASSYIEPDLSGRSIRSMHPTRTAPAIIIEVIQSHIPDEATFHMLLLQTLANHIVIFYFVASGQTESQFNSIWAIDKRASLRAAMYMVGGRLFQNAVEITLSRNKARSYQKARIRLERMRAAVNASPAGIPAGGAA